MSGSREDLKHLSFEFFPPRTERGRHNLLRTARRLAEFAPNFFSVTQGAGGSARDGTFTTVRMLREHGFDAIPHLSWGTDTEAEIASLLRKYLALEVDQLVVIRGDEPADGTGVKHPRFGSELVTFVREAFGDAFSLHVGCYPEKHPEAPSMSMDLRHLRAKVDAGANTCITQYFFNVQAFREFERLYKEAGIELPLIPGLMPISNVEKLVNFSAKCGADIPRWLAVRLEDLQNDPHELRDFVADVVTELTSNLLDFGAPGVHFYTLNLSRPTQAILNRLFDR